MTTQDVTRTGEAKRSKSRLAGIEGVRAIAATSVLVFHVYLYGAPDGRPVDLGPFTNVADFMRAGVTLFFVLSGFLLYRVFVSAALREQPMPSVRPYLRNRALRILPAYWVILVATTVVFDPELLTRPLMFAANVLMVQNYFPAYAAGGEEGLGIVPSWSLVIEVSFYLLLPILGYIAIRLAARKGRAIQAALVPVAAMFVIGFAAKLVARAMEQTSDEFRVWTLSIPMHADWFAAGMALAVARVLYEDDRLAIRRIWLVAGTVVAALVAVLTAKLYYDGLVVSYVESQTPNAILFAFALGLVVLSPPTGRAVRWLSLRPVVFLGLASYSLFLVHDPVVRGFREWGLTSAGVGGFFLNLALIGSVCVLVASASYLYVERPALARKRNWQAGDQAGLGSSAPPDGTSEVTPVLLGDTRARLVQATQPPK